MAQPQMEARETQVHIEIMELAASTSILRGAVDTLEKRLTPILRATDVGGSKAELSPAQLVPLASKLNERSSDISSIHRHVEDIVARLEI